MATPRKSKCPRRPRPAAKEVMSDAASPAIVSGAALSANMSETVTPRQFSVEGE